MELQLPPQPLHVWQLTASGLVNSVPAITDDASYEASSKWVAEAKAERKALEAMRLEVTRKIDAVKAEIMAEEKRIAEPLDKAIEDVLYTQKVYVAVKQEQARKAQAEAERKAKLVQDTANAVQSQIDLGLSRIAQWSTAAEAQERMALVQSWTPVAPSGIDVVLFKAKWSEAKPALIAAAEQKLADLKAGKVTEVAPVVVSTVKEQLAIETPEPTMPLRGVTTKKVAVLATDDLMQIDVYALLHYADKATVLEFLGKCAKKLPADTQVIGVNWVEEARIQNRK